MTRAKSPSRAPATAPIVMAITGASGAPYGIRLLEQLLVAGRRVSLIVSSHGYRLLETESEVKDLAGLRKAVGAKRFDALVTVFDDKDRGAAPASGSSLAGGMVICPCSMGTLASIAAGTSRSLVERAADVALKERRPLLMVTRETPLSLIHLENMRRVTLAGAVVMPAAPGFYHRPQKVSDLVDFIVARALDHLGVPNELAPRWGGTES
ncbi:MAG: UbiX family flavin prenyltransferase [Gemmatimonadetes bacterium]|nr:UbiX family flavin prenyltransferase [Gemmatimonadota bacterium]